MTEKLIQNNAWRRYLLLGGFALAAGFLGWRALSIQVLDNDFLQNQGDARHIRDIPLTAHRGAILDRNGEVLALSTPVSSIWMNPADVRTGQPGFRKLSNMTGMSAASIARLANSRQDKSFVYLKRHIDPQLTQGLSELRLSGIGMQREYRRYYPGGEVNSHLLGFTNIDDTGLEGVELLFDDVLRGTPGRQQVVKDRLGRVIDDLGVQRIAEPGSDLRLSIDKRLQYIAYRELKAAYVKYRAKSASLVVLNAHTGEILALANQPAYNPNDVSQRQGELYRNRAVTDVFEPGSTIKPFVMAAALKSDDFDLQAPVPTSPGYMRVGNSTIRDVRNFGLLTAAEVIKKSSNVGITKIAMGIQREQLWETLSDVGFGETTGSRLPGEVSGHLPFFSSWSKVDRASLSYGYGLSVTPLQLAQAYATLANGGYWQSLSLLKGGDRNNRRRVLPVKVVDQVLAMMEQVVGEGGTGRKAAVRGYRVAGKTGTAKKLKNGSYDGKNYTASFAGIAPVSRPELAVVVMIDEPSTGVYYGGEVAAPVFSRVMQAALRLQNIPPDRDGPPIRLAEVDPL